jgi:hypothetical protein
LRQGDSVDFLRNIIRLFEASWMILRGELYADPRNITNLTAQIEEGVTMSVSLYHGSFIYPTQGLLETPAGACAPSAYR